MVWHFVDLQIKDDNHHLLIIMDPVNEIAETDELGKRKCDSHLCGDNAKKQKINDCRKIVVVDDCTKKISITSGTSFTIEPVEPVLADNYFGKTITYTICRNGDLCHPPFVFKLPKLSKDNT